MAKPSSHVPRVNCGAHLHLWSQGWEGYLTREGPGRLWMWLRGRARVDGLVYDPHTPGHLTARMDCALMYRVMTTERFACTCFKRSHDEAVAWHP